MIVALEGPDLSGKTTLFNALKLNLGAVKFVPALPTHPDLLPLMPRLELRAALLWEALHEDGTVYVCDRCVFTSAPVYDAHYNRVPLYDYSLWRDRVRVLYLDLPVAELQRRYRARGDECFDGRFEAVIALYKEKVLSVFDYMVVDASMSLVSQITFAAHAVEKWRHGWM